MIGVILEKKNAESHSWKYMFGVFSKGKQPSSHSCKKISGVESVLRSLSTALDLKNPTLLKLGYSLLTEILKR